MAAPPLDPLPEPLPDEPQPEEAEDAAALGELAAPHAPVHAAEAATLTGADEVETQSLQTEEEAEVMTAAAGLVVVEVQSAHVLVVFAAAAAAGVGYPGDLC